MFNFPDAPVLNEVYDTGTGKSYKWDGVSWFISGSTTTATTDYGDVKSSFAMADHGGWVMLDGRAVSTLTPTQQDIAIQLGFAANLPDATDAVPLQTATTKRPDRNIGGIIGSMTRSLVLANLPVHNLSLTGLNTSSHDPAAATTSAHDPASLSTSSVDTATATTSSAGDHTHQITAYRSNGGGIENLIGKATDNDQDTTFTATEPAGAHTHTVDVPNHSHTVDLPSHTHTVDLPSHTHTIGGTLPLGGSGTAIEIRPRHFDVRFFLYLGL